MVEKLENEKDRDINKWYLIIRYECEPYCIYSLNKIRNPFTFLYKQNNF